MRSSLRISSAMASRSASRTVSRCMAVPCGMSGSDARSFATGFSATGTGAGVGSGSAVSASAAGAGAGAAAGAAASSPSPAIVAITVPTLTLSVPSGTRIEAIVPSSMASNSIVALSVSISARMSPDFTVSPSLTSHLASVPSSIVGESAGIFNSIAISILLHQHVGIEFGKVGLRRTFGKVGRVAHDLADLLVDLLEFVFADSSVLHQLFQMLDSVTLVAHRLNFLPAAIFGRVGHRVAAIAIGLELEEDRPLARAHPFERGFRRAAHREHVHAVDLDAGDAEALAAAIELVFGRRAIDRGAHRILIVLDHENDRQFPELGHVEALVHLALVRRAVAEIGHGDAAVPAVFVGKGKARAERHLRADNAMPAIEFML